MRKGSASTQKFIPFSQALHWTREGGGGQVLWVSTPIKSDLNLGLANLYPRNDQLALEASSIQIPSSPAYTLDCFSLHQGLFQPLPRIALACTKSLANLDLELTNLKIPNTLGNSSTFKLQ